MGTGHGEAFLTRLLPSPREIRPLPGRCGVDQHLPLEIRVGDPRLETAANRWITTLATGPSGAGSLRVEVDPHSTPNTQGYRLTVDSSGILVLGASPQGCFYALQTLGQLTSLDGDQVPCCEIRDWPDFNTRGLLHDVTRGKVPTLETLKLLVDRLAGLKMNQLQLYIEHAFVFSFDSDICDADNGLTPDEVRSLDEYARERFIDLVPALATFGHMGRVLSMSKYRHLAEIEATATWEDLTWPQRARGFTLDCANPQSHRLVEHLWNDVLDAFKSPVVNICGDEPWDLGEGKNRHRFSGGGKADAYVDQIVRTRDICAGRGRRVLLWDDIIRNYPKHISRLPGDATVLHWSYDDDAPHDDAHIFPKTGFKTFVCPGTLGWKRVLNAVNLAERNIAGMARLGREWGATGLVNTDWGDHGHFNALAGSWHGIALGASLGWSVDHALGKEFDEAFARAMLRTDDAEGVRLLRDAAAVADSHETWRLMWTPLSQVVAEEALPGADGILQATDSARNLRRWCNRAGDSWIGNRRDLAELGVAAWFTDLFCRKMAFALCATGAAGIRNGAGGSRKQWADELDRAGKAFAECWLARNKPSGLGDILRTISAIAGSTRCDRSD